MSTLRAIRNPITGFPSIDAGVYSGLDRTSPFPASTDIYGTRVHGSYGNLQNAVNWQRQQAARMREGFQNTLRNIGIRPITANTPFSFSPIQPLNPPAQVADQTSQASPTDNPYQTVSNVKNPAIQEAINRSLTSINGLNADPTRNTTTVHRNVRNPAIEQRVQDMLARYDADVGNNAQSVADFAASILGSQADQRRRADQEIGSLDEIYSGKFAGDLQRINDQRKISMRSGTNTAINRALRQNNLARMVGGDSSYLDALRAGRVGSIMEDEAIRQSELDRANLMAVRDMQNKQVGTRNRLLDDVLRRPLDIIDARQRTAGNDIANFGNISNIDNANSLYTTDSPEAMLSRRLDLLRGTSALDQANMFYGLRSPSDPDMSGLILAGANNFGGGRRSSGYNGDDDWGGGDGGYMGGGSNDEFGGSWVSDGRGGQVFKQSNKLKSVRRSQGWRADINGNYTIRPQGRWSGLEPSGFALPNDFSGYGDPNSDFYYPDYPGANEINRMQDYYENGFVGGDTPSPMIDYGGGDDFSLDDYADYYNYNDW